MQIVVEKITEESLLREVCEFTMLGNKTSKMTFENMLKLNHSPIRTQIYVVKMYDIPAFVAHHIRTHNVGIMGHWITSRRDDRGGEAEERRSEPVDHMFIANAEALINMAHQRLCPMQVHKDTLNVVQKLMREVHQIEPVLKDYLVPGCVYRNGICNQLKSCGKSNG